MSPTVSAGRATGSGATPVEARALAPDLARGAMLLLIALANVRIYLYRHPLGIRGFPRDATGLDRVVAMAEVVLVDGRAYPMFGLLFGYGVVQLSRRRAGTGRSITSVTALVRRRGAWMLAIGAVHGALLWSGDIVGAYGLIAVVAGGLLVAGSDHRLLAVAVVGAVLSAAANAGSGLPATGGPRSLMASNATPDAAGAALGRLGEWAGIGLGLQAVGVFGAVALGALAARRRLLDDPERHRRLLTGAAVGGITVAVLGGLPLALLAVGVPTGPPVAVGLGAAALHALAGYAGGIGYAAAFGLLAIRVAARSGPPGPTATALVACGQRSLSCYLAQSVLFAALLPAWTAGLGGRLDLAEAAALAAGVWAVVVLAAAACARTGRRGPAEVLLRRLTYGPRPRGDRAAGNPQRAAQIPPSTGSTAPVTHAAARELR